MKQADWSYLCGVPQDYEADIIIALLDLQNIPAIKRYPGAGEFLKTAYGISSGVDIYVPPGQLENAQSLINDKSAQTIGFDSEVIEELEENKELEDEDSNSSSWRIWGAILILIVLFSAIATQRHMF